jgi:hypothetical protein
MSVLWDQRIGWCMGRTCSVDIWDPLIDRIELEMRKGLGVNRGLPFFSQARGKVLMLAQERVVLDRQR